MPFLKTKQNKHSKSRGQRSWRISNQVGCAGASEKHLTCTVKIFEYRIMSNSVRRPERKKKNQTKHIQQLSEYMGAERKQIRRSSFPAQLKFEVIPIAHHFWRLKNCVELIKVRIGKKMLALEETKRNFGRDTSDLVDNTELSGKEEHTLETKLNPWQ